MHICLVKDGHTCRVWWLSVNVLACLCPAFGLCWGLSAGVESPVSSNSTRAASWHRSVAVNVITGHEVAYHRIPGLLNTWLSDVKQLVLISDRELRIGIVTAQDATSTVNRVESEKQRGSKRHLAEMEASASTLNSPGWRASAMRVLPGLRATRQRFQDASWYIQVDDDSYVFMNTLWAWLEEFDPQQAHYLGTPIEIDVPAECAARRRKKAGQLAMWLCFGGTACIMSKAAMDKLDPNYEECMVASADCPHGGDVRVAACLAQSDVHLNMRGPPYVHIDAPVNMWLNWGLYNVCDRPIGVHHVSAEIAQVLFDAEAHSKQPTMADILGAVDQHTPLSSQADCRYQPEPDFLLSATADTQQECLNKCLAHGSCKTWSFLGEWHSCQLMTKLTQATKHENSLCGVLVARYICDSNT